jgi:hypothetical protein
LKCDSGQCQFWLPNFLAFSLALLINLAYLTPITRHMAAKMGVERMTLEEFKATNNGEALRGQRVTHPIYGPGNVLKLARHCFAWVAFDTPRTDRMAVLAVSLGVCV